MQIETDVKSALWRHQLLNRYPNSLEHDVDNALTVAITPPSTQRLLVQAAQVVLQLTHSPGHKRATSRAFYAELNTHCHRRRSGHSHSRSNQLSVALSQAGRQSNMVTIPTESQLQDLPATTVNPHSHTILTMTRTVCRVDRLRGRRKIVKHQFPAVLIIHSARETTAAV
ncbi:hypothetical protein RRG08_016868 [Elysia crispata]|uniref:Uncharacterized protein n=1 Tax=Elysia crispata TaxID=231223 RepID=A0AAE0XNK6_9GAST|nr:hypothetical protein RRG08_016868 [Elysia crispata]